MTTVTAGNTAHVILKPSQALPDVQLLTIPGAKHEYHVLLRSGNGDTTAYPVDFFEPSVSHRTMAAAPSPTPALKVTMVSSCAAPLY